MRKVFSLAVLALLLLSCRDELVVTPGDEQQVDSLRANVEYSGFYLLNEGNMGSNKATLDFFNFETGKYIRNIYAELRNGDLP